MVAQRGGGGLRGRYVGRLDWMRSRTVFEIAENYYSTLLLLLYSIQWQIVNAAVTVQLEIGRRY